MHAVSPVHIYYENHVKTPMTGTNIDETVKTLNKEKRKKALQKNTKNVFDKNQNKKIMRPRSCSPKEHGRKQSENLSVRRKCNNEHSNLKYDEIPERDLQNAKKTCDVCIEAKQRSRSPSIKYASNKSLDNQDNINNLSDTFSSAASFNEFLKRKQNHQKISRSLEQLNNETYILDDKANAKHFHDFNKFDNKLSNHELLIQKLIETEGIGNDITKQLSALKDFLKLHYNETQVTSLTIKRLENDRDMLLKNLEDYENVNRDLREVLYNIKAIEKSDYRRNLTNETLIKHIDGLEQENNHLKKLLLDVEKNVMQFGNENDHFKLENSALCNLKLSLENNRAHLQKQLNSREAEINRLNVKLRIAERKMERFKSELDEFKKDNVNENQKQKNEPTIDVQTKQYIAKLQNEIKQKDVLIKELVHESKKFESESNTKFNKESETSRSKNSIDTGRLDRSKEEKLKNTEAEISRLKNDLNNANMLILKLQENNSKIEKETDDTLQSADDKENEAKRIKRFRELELDKVRAKLQQRLNELEPLPELLKNTELKLHESLKRQKEYEAENSKQGKFIQDLEKKIEKLEHFHDEKEKNMHLKSSLSTSNTTHKESTTSRYRVNEASNDMIEKKIKSLEEENHDLFRQLSHKDETLREANNRLTIKTNEASSLSRQLEAVLSDGKHKEEHIKDKYSSKERSLQTRCIELETQLSKLKIDINSIKREKEEIEYKYQSQLKDLKDKLEQSYATNKSMQNYVNFLKNSYSTMFNDNIALNTAMGSYTINANDLNQNILSKTGSTNFF